jgi:prevent-host-death family protein
MTKVLERPAQDLHNNYGEIVKLANEGNRVIITQDGHEDIVLISAEAFKEFEDLLYHQYICQELDKSWEESKDPNAVWISHEDFWAEFKDLL